MSNPQLNFRLHPHQIALGVQYILNLEPYQPALSASLLVKTLYLDTLTKASFNKTIHISSAVQACANAMMNQHATQEERTALWKIAANQNMQDLQVLKQIKAEDQAALQPIPTSPSAPAPMTNQPPNMAEIIAAVMQQMQPTQPVQPVNQIHPTATLTVFEQAAADQVLAEQATSKAEQAIAQPDFDEQIELANQYQNKKKPSEYDTSGEFKTDSTITTVTDFSPPEEWRK